jgi:hypothetical protein
MIDKIVSIHTHTYTHTHTHLQVWLVLEFCGNGELKKNIERHGPMPEDTLSFTGLVNFTSKTN